jgi:hypothetical protein
MPAASVSGGGNLSGDGTLGAASVTYLYGGEELGLTLSQLTLNGSMGVNIAGASTYSRVNVTGNAALNNSTLQVYLSAAYAPSQGQQFVLLQAGSLTGTFQGLADGAVMTLNSADFRLSYAGNKVTLTCIRAPKTWTGAVNGLWSVAGNWLGGVPQSGDVIQFPSGAANKTSMNDLPAGTAFAAITVNDFGYAFSGNRIVLTGTLANNGMNQLVLDLPVDIQGNSVNVSGMMGFRFNAPLSGTGTINNSYAGLQFAGSHPFAGTIVLGNGSVTLQAGAFDAGGFGERRGQPVRRWHPRCGQRHVPVWRRGVGPDPLAAHAQRLDGRQHRRGEHLQPRECHRQRGAEQLDPAGVLERGLRAFPRSAVRVAASRLPHRHLPGTGRWGRDDPQLGRLPAELCGQQGDLDLHPAPKTWTGAVNGLWSVAGNWLGGVPQSGDVIQFPSGAANKTSMNDLPAGTAFAAITVNDFGYAFSGNRIVLTGTLANNGMNQLVLDLPVDIQGNSVNVSGMMGFRFNAPLIGTGRSTTPMRDSSSRDPILSPEPSSWATAR